MRSLPWLGTILFSLGLTATTVGLDAQARVAPGVRLRTRWGPTPVAGTVVSLSETILVLRRDVLGDTLQLPLGSLSDVRVADRHRGSALGPKLGWLAGGGLGYGIALVAGQRSDNAAGLPIIVGGLLGALAGLSVKTDRWLPAPVLPPPPRLIAAAADSVRPAALDTATAREAAGRRDTIAGWQTPAPGAESLNLRQLRASAGERIRYESAEAPGVRRIARILRVEGDTVVLLPDILEATPVRIDGRSLRAIELSLGWSGRGNRTGAMIGSLLGVGAGVLAYRPLASSDYFGLGLILCVGLGASVGAAVGTVVGNTGYRERWGPPPLASVAVGSPATRPSVRLVPRF